jgi:hypothetical protein
MERFCEYIPRMQIVKLRNEILSERPIPILNTVFRTRTQR